MQIDLAHCAGTTPPKVDPVLDHGLRSANTPSCSRRSLVTRGLAFAAVLAAAVGLSIATLSPRAEAGVLFGAARGAITKRALKPQPQQVAQQAAGKPRDVIIHRAQHPEAAEHIEHAQRNGQPTVLHINRAGANANRAASTGGVKLNPKPAPHYERDEYPPAFTREGGHNANVRFIKPHDNRGAGSTMRAQTRDLPDGSKIRVLVAD